METQADGVIGEKPAHGSDVEIANEVKEEEDA